VKRSLYALALAGLAVAAARPALALDTSAIDNVDHEPVINLAEAYPCVIGTYPDSPTNNAGITQLQTFCGNLATSTPLVNGAAPGILSLKRAGDPTDRLRTNFNLDVNCFVTKADDEATCTVQAYRFFKLVPGSFKCPDVYGLPHFDDKGNLIPYMYTQFGTGVRTWWSLNFTQPGTRFLLQVVVACQLNTGGVRIRMESWRWRVVADQDTLLYVINLMHGGAISTLEVPCILGEDMYDALIAAQVRLRTAILSTADNRLTEVGNAIFDFEALIVANCLFVEVLNPLVTFPGAPQFGAPNIQPPGNLAQTVFFGQGSAVAGIIDTIEHPCCCKLLVDLEWITLKNGIIGQTPQLPTF
jgi:hypothetical protein